MASQRACAVHVPPTVGSPQRISRERTGESHSFMIGQQASQNMKAPHKSRPQPTKAPRQASVLSCCPRGPLHGMQSAKTKRHSAAVRGQARLFLCRIGSAQMHQLPSSLGSVTCQRRPTANSQKRKRRRWWSTKTEQITKRRALFKRALVLVPPPRRFSNRPLP